MMENNTQCLCSDTSIENKKMVKKLKIIAVGDGMVGITSMIKTYINKSFPSESVPTFVYQSYENTIVLDSQKYNIQWYVTAGQDDFDKLRPLCYTGAACFLLCYSIARRTSFHNIEKKWYKEVKHYCPEIPLILVGTKEDLRSNKSDCITQKEAEMMKNKIGAVKEFTCSAFTNEGLETMFVETIGVAIQALPTINKVV